MANEIKIVDGTYAVLRNDQVVGVVERTSEQWAFRPIVPGVSTGVTSYVPLHHALEAARKFEPS